MKVRFSVLADASGSLGGVVASHNRGGRYLRPRVVPTDPRSIQQVNMRTILGNLAAAWQTITAAQRSAWETYAVNVPITDKFGDPLTLTGQQMYVRCNANIVRAGKSRVDDGPTVFAQDSLSPLGFSGSETGDSISVTFTASDDWVGEDDAGLVIFGSRQKSVTRNFHKGPYRYAGTILGNATTPPTSPDATLTNPFALTQGNKFFLRALSFRADGRISPVQFYGPTAIGA